MRNLNLNFQEKIYCRYLSLIKTITFSVYLQHDDRRFPFVASPKFSNSSPGITIAFGDKAFPKTRIACVLA